MRGEVWMGRSLLALLGLAATPSQSAERGIDLITLGVPDLQAAVSVIEAIGGVRPALGGVHPTRGTHNAVLSLGEGAYLEILAALPAPEPTAAPELRELGRPTLLWWAVGSTDAALTAASVAGRGFATEDPVAGSRQTPDGQVLAWQTFRLAPVLRGGPFFIQWSANSLHPSTTAPSGCLLESLEVASPDAEALGRLMPDPPSRLSIQPATEPRLQVRIRCPRGNLVFESD